MRPRKNQKAQQTIEYVILFSALIGSLVYFAGQGGLFQTSLNQSEETLLTKVECEANRLYGGDTSACPSDAVTPVPPTIPPPDPTASPTTSPTATPLGPTPTSSPVTAATPTATPQTATPLSTGTGPPTSTPTGTPTSTPTDTATATSSPTSTPTSSPTGTPPTATPLNTPTFTPSATPSFTPTVTPTFTPTSTPLNTPTYTPTSTPSFTPTSSPTATPVTWGCGNGSCDIDVPNGRRELCNINVIFPDVWCPQDCCASCLASGGEACASAQSPVAASCTGSCPNGCNTLWGTWEGIRECGSPQVDLIYGTLCQLLCCDCAGQYWTGSTCGDGWCSHTESCAYPTVAYACPIDCCSPWP